MGRGGALLSRIVARAARPHASCTSVTPLLAGPTSYVTNPNHSTDQRRCLTSGSELPSSRRAGSCSTSKLRHLLPTSIGGSLACSFSPVYPSSHSHHRRFSTSSSSHAGSSGSRTMKRFFKSVSIASGGPDCYEILLDGKKLKTPSGNVMAIPNQSLALAVATEWVIN